MKKWQTLAYRPFRAMLKQQFLLLTRYPVNLVANFVLVLVMAIAVTLLITVFAPAAMGVRLKGMTLYGFIIYIFLSHTIWTVGLGIQKEKTEGTLTGLYLTPASRFLTLLARALAALSWTAVAGLLGLLLAQAITGPLVFHSPWLALGILFFTLSGLVGLGFAIAGLALNFGESIELVANIFEFGLMGLCAFFFPFSVLPPALQNISRLIPLSYSVDAFRTVALGQMRPELLPLNAELTIIIATGLFGPVVGFMIYLASEKKARQAGDL
ncbi:MAG: ABC transporter permease [Anaerolineae bacterium]|nr:ABC transporter permease [Anaerolineae bacterium]